MAKIRSAQAPFGFLVPQKNELNEEEFYAILIKELRKFYKPLTGLMEKEDPVMPKMIIMYNLRDDLKEEDFVNWVHEFKGPFIEGLPSVNSYVLSKTETALESKGGPLEPAEIPYNIVGIVDVTSMEAYAKDQETPAYKDDFTPKMMKWVKNMTYLKIKEFFPKP